MSAYALYQAGSDSFAAKRAKRHYVAERRAAGVEPMSGYRTPTVETGKGVPVALVAPRQKQMLDVLREIGQDDPPAIAERLGVTPVTVRRQLLAVCRGLDLKDRTHLARSLRAGEINYRSAA